METTSINAVFVFLIILAVNAILTHILIRYLSPFMLDKGVYGYDVNKPVKNKLPEEGGVSIAIAMVFAFMLYGYFLDFPWVSLLAITTALISLIGFVDRLRNIRPYPKFVYCAVVGSVYSISFFQDPGVSIYYAVAFLILGSVMYSVLVNSFNLLAGFNGLESGLAVISSLALAMFFVVKGYYAAAGIALIQMTGFVVFWQFNKFPARIFLGDSGSLIPGSVFFGLALLTRQWIPILFIMAPHLLNMVIKFYSTGVSSKSDFAPLVYKEEKLYLPQKNYWSLIRLYLATGPKSEKAIVYFVFSVELLFCCLLFVFYV